MVKSVYIFRHGETDYNVDRRAQGWVDVPLNNNGKIQAKVLGRKLSGVKLDCVYSSPLLRAMETAKIVVDSNGSMIKIITNDNLKERNFGEFEGKIVRLTDAPADTAINIDGDIIYVPRVLLDDNCVYVPETGESYDVFRQRVSNVILDIIKNADAESIGISTHGCFIRMLVRHFFDIKLPIGGVPNAEYLKMQWDGKKLALPDLELVKLNMS